MDILQSVAPTDWLRLIFALLLFLGPGYAVAGFYSRAQQLDRTVSAALALACSLALWPLLLAWLQAVKITLTPTTAISFFCLGWLVWAATQWCCPGARGNLPEQTKQNHPSSFILHPSSFILHPLSLALWSSLLVTALLSLSLLRGTFVMSGSDGYHHTLFAQVIMAHGGLPDDLLPLTPLASFTYHPGFHSFVAAIGWLSGISAVALAPILGQLLKAGAALSAAFFAYTVLEERRPGFISGKITGKITGVIAALMIGLVAVFPAYYVNWSRNTQLTGFVILPVLLALLWCWTVGKWNWQPVPLVALLAAGLVMTHYRVTVMAVIGALLVVAVNVLTQARTLREYRGLLLRLITTAGLAGLLVSAWLWHIYTARQVGYPVDIGTQSEGVFDLARLGAAVTNYPTNGSLLVLVALAVVWGWWRRQPVVIMLTLWSAALLWLSGPRWLGIYMDTVTVFISLYFPAGIVVGWLGATGWQWLATTRWPQLRWLVMVGCLALAVQGALAMRTILDPTNPFVLADDLPAMRWIAQNTPADAYFMVNTFHFDIAPNYVIGWDAGFWLPVLAQRRTVTAPMTYPVERNVRPDYVARLVALDQLHGELTSPQALRLLAQEGITYVYVGQRGGPINVPALLASPAFELAYHNGTAYVFHVIYGRLP